MLEAVDTDSQRSYDPNPQEPDGQCAGPEVVLLRVGRTSVHLAFQAPTAASRPLEGPPEATPKSDTEPRSELRCFPDTSEETSMICVCSPIAARSSLLSPLCSISPSPHLPLSPHLPFCLSMHLSILIYIYLPLSTLPLRSLHYLCLHLRLYSLASLMMSLPPFSLPPLVYRPFPHVAMSPAPCVQVPNDGLALGVSRERSPDPHC